MTEQGVSCLFCMRGLEITEEPKNNKRKARVLSLIHKRLCSVLKLDFPTELRKWDFSQEPFAFCLRCQKVILKLCRLIDQLKALELEISRCASTLSMLTITSKSNSAELLISAAPEADDSNSVKIGKKLKEKHQFFRDIIIQRFNAKVRIEPIKNHTSNFIDAVTASLNADAQPKEAEDFEVSSVYPHVVIAADNYYDDVEDDDNCFDSSPMSPEPGSPPGNEATWGSCPSPAERDHLQEPSISSSSVAQTSTMPSDSSTPITLVPSDFVPITAACENSEIPNNSVLKDTSCTKYNLDSQVCVKEDLTAADEPQQDVNAPAEKVVETCELDIKIRPLPDQGGTKNGQQEQFEDRRVSKEQAKTVNQLGNGLYELNGFRFTELEKGFECSTCKHISSFAAGWPEKQSKSRNIQKHIRNVHIWKQSAFNIQRAWHIRRGKNDRDPKEAQRFNDKARIQPSNPDFLMTPSGAAPSNSETLTPFSSEHPGGSVPITAGCDNSEINLNSISTDPSSSRGILESELSIKDVNTAVEDLQQDENTPEEESVETCELDIKIRPFPDQKETKKKSQKTKRLSSGSRHARTEAKLVHTLRNAKIRLHAGVEVLINSTRAICLNCNLMFELRSGSRSAWDQAKEHIDECHESSSPTPLVAESTSLDDPNAKLKVNSFPAKKSVATGKPKVNLYTRCYAGVKYSVLGPTARCSKCCLEFETKDGEAGWLQAKKHIAEQHAIPGIKVPPIKKEYHVEVVDKDKKLYRVMGHEFQELENGYECSTCKKIFPFAPLRHNHKKNSNVKSHILKIHGRTGQGRCEICNADVKNLAIHMRMLHGGESGRKVCELCGKEFKSIQSLVSHRRGVHRRVQQEKKFHCDDCGTKFKAKANLLAHQRIHGGEKPYVCEHCGKTFRFNHVFKTHVASAHGERKFACDQCDWKFGVKFLLTRHVKQVHQGIKPPPPKKKRKKVQEPREESQEETSESDSVPEAGVEEA